MKLCALLLVVALINWWLSVPVPEDPSAEAKPERPEGSYATDALIFALCFLGVMYQRKRDADRDD